MSFTLEESEALKHLSQQLVSQAAEGLSHTLGQTVTVDGPELALNNSLAEVPDLFDGDTPLLGLVQLKGTDETPLSLGFLLKSAQAKVLADYMMGGAGAPDDSPLSDLQLSAVGEALNQMLNTALLSLNANFSRPLELLSPEILPFDPETLSQLVPAFEQDGVVSVHYSLALNTEAKVADPLDMVMLLANTEAQALLELYKETAPEEAAQAASPLPVPAANAVIDQDLINQVLGSAVNAGFSSEAEIGGNAPSSAARPTAAAVMDTPVTVKPVQFGSFDQQLSVYGEENRNLDLVMDIKLNLTVELGRTRLTIKEVLELTRGSVVELNRIAGEPVDLYANGKLIAKGEVVVIEDNFGLRVTNIVAPSERLKGL